MLYCHIHSDAEGARDQELREKRKRLSLPGLVFLDVDGEVLVQVPHGRSSVGGISATGRRAERYLELRAKAAENQEARAAFLQMQLEERQLDYAAATKAYASIDSMTSVQRARLDELLLYLKISTEVNAKGQRGRWELGKRYWRMWQSESRPGVHVSRGYWWAILDWAERERDLESYAQAIEAFRSVLEQTDKGKAWVAPLIARCEKRLVELRRQK